MKNKILLTSIFVIVLFSGAFWYVKNVSQYFLTPEKAQVSVNLKNQEVYNLEATEIKKVIDGKSYKMLAYNGSIPGPTINVEQGSEITINFTNNTAGNQLLHSHGVRMENIYDGSQMVQKEMKPGETFSYKLKLEDAGVYWYHPHVSEPETQMKGLYGAFVVKPKSENYFSKVNSEEVLFLSDVLIQDNKINAKSGEFTLMGHFGNILLVNGKENYQSNLNAGQVKRFYLINSSNARPYNFAISNAKMKLVGGDNGAYEKEAFVDTVLLGPSERAIVDVYFENPGVATLQNVTPDKTYTLGMINVSSQKIGINLSADFKILKSNNETTDSIKPFLSYFNNAPDKKLDLTLTMNMGSMAGMNMSGDSSGKVNLMGMEMTKEQATEHCQMMPNMEGCGPYLQSSITNTKKHGDGIEWEDTMASMNAMSNNKNVQWKIVDRDTKKENMDIKWEFQKDKPAVIEIFNDPKSVHPMQHPIHFHGQRFLVAERDSVKQTNLVWKDTVLIKTGERVKIVLDPSNVGDWMAHCHISEHLENNMMFGFKVI